MRIKFSGLLNTLFAVNVPTSSRMGCVNRMLFKRLKEKKKVYFLRKMWELIQSRRKMKGSTKELTEWIMNTSVFEKSDKWCQ